jgi:putative ABC transport system permease protein
MNLIENIKMAIDSIFSNKMRSFLTMLGIIIGISSVISIVSLGQGGKNTISGEFEKIGVSSVIIEVDKTEAQISDYITFEDIEQIRNKIPYVKYVSPFINRQGIAKSDRKSKTALLAGGNEDMFAINNQEILWGRFFNKNEFEEGKMVVIIDEDTAKNLFGTTDVVGESIHAGKAASTKKLTIIGVTKSQMGMFGDVSRDQIPAMLYLPATSLNIIFSEANIASEMILQADTKENTEIAGVLAKNLLGNRHGNLNRDLYKAENMMKYIDQINNVMGIFTTFVAAVAAISLLVGGVGVMNIMLVSVTERTREIGIRKAVGARTGHILLQFLTESAIISLIGGIIGLISGILGAHFLGRLAGITPSISLQIIVIAILFSSAVGIFFGIYPAKKAAKLDPIEALRYE